MAHGESNRLELGRQLYEQRAWTDAYHALALADQQSALEAEDLERLAMATYLIGRDDEYLATLERAHGAYLNNGQCARAVRCAFWLAFRLLMRGETGRATGWLARSERLLSQQASECAERGYLLLPVVEQRIASRDFATAHAIASEAVLIGERCGDADLVVCAQHQQGRIRLLQGQTAAGLALLDEVMVAVTGGQLSPLVTGLMYCSVIAACQQVYAVDRSREWTAALAQWCDDQPNMVAFAGVCRVHRAEVMQLLGAWPDALEEARRACARSQHASQRTAAAAFYQEAEVLRLKGDFTAAEEAYRRANELGMEPLPGLALMRLAQGRLESAEAAIRRATAVATDPLKRMGLLPACVEILLAASHVEDARLACEELQRLARSFDTGVPAAIAAQSCGAVSLAEGDAQAALGPLRQAFEVWQRIPAPHEMARVRVLMGQACRALGDEDAAVMQIEAARNVFAQLGAMPDLARIDSLQETLEGSGRPYGLTARELQVLRLVAAGDSNKTIATTLSLSEKTIERHVSNILTKLDVSSRTAATTFAHQHKLL